MYIRLVSINFLWFNQNLNSHNKFIWPESLTDIVDKSLTSWRAHNSTVERLNFWYLSHTCTPKQIENTYTWLAQRHPTYVFLKDFIAAFPEETSVFVNPRVGIYWKVDVARTLIANYLLSPPQNPQEDLTWATCYVDLDLEAVDLYANLSQHENVYARRLLFFGALYASSQNTASGTENGFFIQSRANLSMMQATRLVLGTLAINFMKYLLKRCAKNTDLFKRILETYLVNQWGFQNSPLVLFFEFLLKTPPNSAFFLLTGKVFNVRTKPLLPTVAIKLLHSCPFLIYESFRLQSGRAVNSEVLVEQSYLQFPFVNGSYSTNALPQEEAERFSALINSGIGHEPSVVHWVREEVRLLKETQPDLFEQV